MTSFAFGAGATAMRCLLILLLLALLAGCAYSTPVQPCCSGPLFPLNPGTWMPGAGDLAS